MKSILLASASVFAFAGAAAADDHTGVDFTGDAELGYNDTGGTGFYWDGNIAVALSQELDNGLTAGVDFDADFADNNLGDDLVAGGYVLYIESDTAALRFGDLDPVAEDNWGGVDGSAADDFYDQDIHFLPVDLDGDGTDENVGFDALLVGEISYGGIDGMISYGVDTDGTASAIDVDELDALQLYATGNFGNINVEMAFQNAIETSLGDTGTRLGLAASTTFGGADVTVAFADRGGNDLETDETSFGIDLAYPVGPVTAGAYFTSNDNASDTYGISADYSEGPLSVSASYEDDVDGNAEDYGIEGSYDVGNGLVILAGVVDSFDDTYVAGEYNLGGGAGLLVSFADDSDGDAGDEVGDPEYQDGTTVEVSFEF